MKQLTIEIEENGTIVKTGKFDISDNDTVESLAQKVSTELEIDYEEVIENLDGNFGSLKAKGDKEKKIKIRRVCVELHFETKKEKHNFSSNSKWSRVHRWGCQHFSIARDACANLELREDSSGGTAINENNKIGYFTGCKVIWMVKPGAEPNGTESKTNR